MRAVLLLAGVLAGSGCDGGAGDGSFTPEAGVCHRFDVTESGRSGYDPVGCDELHEAETVHVGGERRATPFRRWGVCGSRFRVARL